MSASSAREHHRCFKYALVTRALVEPARFLAETTTAEGATALWTEIGDSIADEDERLPAAGMSVRVLGADKAPVVLFTLPPAERSNEAHFIAIVPAAARTHEGALIAPIDDGSTAPTRFRVFAMERSMLPGGGYIAFVVEWTGTRRRNFDAPQDPSQNAFWDAVLEIFAGTRCAIHSVEMVLGDAHATTPLDTLERATWFSSVGRGLTPGWPVRYDDVRLVAEWDEARVLVQREARTTVVSAALSALRDAGIDYDATMEQRTPEVRELCARKLSAYVREHTAPDELRTLSMLVQMELLGALTALEHAAHLADEHVAAARDLVFFFGEGRFPCAWDATRVTAIH